MPVSPSLQVLLVALEPYPAHLRDGRWNVLAWNAAETVIADWADLPAAERNVLWNRFTSPWLRRISVDWEADGRDLLALFRMDCGRHAGERWFEELVGRLARRSPEFRRWWAEHHVLTRRERPLVFRLPGAGLLEVERVTLIADPDRHVRLRVLVPASPEAEAALRRALAGPEVRTKGAG